MPHFSADLLDALLDGDPAELEALRALLGAGPASGTRCRTAPPAPADQARPRQAAVAARATKRRPGPVSRGQGRTVSRPPMPG